MSSLTRFLVLAARNGSGLILLVCDVALLALWAIDLYQIEFILNIDYLEIVRAVTLPNLSPTALIDFAGLTTVPVVLTIVLNFTIFVVAPSIYYRRTASSVTKSRLMILHILCALLLTVHTSSGDHFRQYGGMCGPIEQPAPCFSSRVGFFAETWFLFACLFSLVIVPAFRLILKDRVRGGRLVREFDFWRQTASIGEYQPAYGDEVIYVNSASMAPSIRFVQQKTHELHERYQRLVPTSGDAAAFLKDRAEDVRRFLRDYLFGDDAESRQSLSIEFFPGTSRALEVAALRVGTIARFLLSPLEHPSQIDVVRWVCETQRAIDYRALRWRFSALRDTATNIQEKLVKELRQELETFGPPDGGSKTAIVLSEVYYVNGMEIPVSEIILELRKTHSELVFIIDGSQAVGGLPGPCKGFVGDLEDDDFYYFSAHKWLLSPNTCGVLVSPVRARDRNSPKPYDVFGVELPTSTIDPNTVFGLAAAMEFLFGTSRLFDRFLENSIASKHLFKELVESTRSLAIVGDNAENASPFVAVHPSLGHKWKYGKEDLWEEMRRRALDFTVIPLHEPHFVKDSGDGSQDYVLRISFPYFLLGKSVKNLVRHLEGLVAKVN